MVEPGSGRRIAGAASPFVGVAVIRRAEDYLRIRSDAQDAAARGGVMAKADGVFIYIGTYPSEVAARGDYDVVKDLHRAGAVGSYDAAVITKDDDGKVHVNKDETATGAGRGVVSRRARSSGCCSRPRSSRPPPSAAPWAASAATFGRACPAPTSRSSAS
jgi:hypothetical protein